MTAAQKALAKVDKSGMKSIDYLVLSFLEQKFLISVSSLSGFSFLIYTLYVLFTKFFCIPRS